MPSAAIWADCHCWLIAASWAQCSPRLAGFWTAGGNNENWAWWAVTASALMIVWLLLGRISSRLWIITFRAWRCNTGHYVGLRPGRWKTLTHPRLRYWGAGWRRHFCRLVGKFIFHPGHGQLAQVCGGAGGFMRRSALGPLTETILRGRDPSAKLEKSGLS